MKVKDVMFGQALETVTPKSLIIDALRQMETKRIHSLLVFDGPQFMGIVTMTDIATTMFGQDGSFVEDIMTPTEKVICVSPNDGLRKCRDIMKKRRIHHLIVKDDGGKVIGVISSIDLMVAENEAREEAAEMAKELPAT